MKRTVRTDWVILKYGSLNLRVIYNLSVLRLPLKPSTLYDHFCDLSLSKPSEDRSISRHRSWNYNCQIGVFAHRINIEETLADC